MVTCRQSEGSIVRGFDNVVLTLTLTLTLTLGLSIVRTRYMAVGLSNPRNKGPSDYRYITVPIPSENGRDDRTSDILVTSCDIF